MLPQRRTALVSVGAAVALIAIKLVTGLGSGSLGLIAEALHSGTDLVAALLTFYAVGYAVKPADVGHPYGHGKAEHLAALAEAAVLALVSIGVAVLAAARLVGWVETEIDAAWWVFVAIGAVIAIDVSRAVVSLRTARRFRSDALLSNSIHFAGDFAGTLAVLVGLLAVRAGWPEGDSIAALLVAALVLVAAARLMRRNVNVLMDRAPADAVAAARQALRDVDPPVDVRRLRLRQAAGRVFADVVIGVSPGEAVAQGHAAADRVEEAIHFVLPGSDVVVHVEPEGGDAALQERVRAAAMAVPSVREIHNLAVIDLDDGTTEASLHLKLPGQLSLDEAHEVAEEVERAIVESVPEVTAVQSHLEPLDEEAAGREVPDVPPDVADIVAAASGRQPRQMRLLRTGEGLVLFLTLVVDGDVTLAEAHEEAGAVAAQIRRAHPEIAEVIVHTEP